MLPLSWVFFAGWIRFRPAGGSEELPTHPGHVAYLSRLQFAWETATSHTVFQDLAEMD